MNTITIPKTISRGDDLVVVPRRDYEALRANQIPVRYLSGRAAARLDRRVAMSIRAHQNGSTRRIKSLADLM
ncbi:MAG: hypothetical protein G01um101417_423 [Parcubacteria group bacterium Gr01-1014_17]|nr:MAG: hypothetical protein G01um101417_423 [Parcubacteria group bacterium Gr01-1014_17]